jgi:DNA-binding PadR family transcriptional regulator
VLERSGGKVRLWPATLYGSLKRLIEKGLIAESGERPAPELDDARRRYYKLTPLGRQVLDLESQRLKDPRDCRRVRRGLAWRALRTAGAGELKWSQRDFDRPVTALSRFVAVR